MSVRPALDVYGYRKGSRMAVCGFHMHGKGGCAASKPHAADSKSIYCVQDFFFEAAHRSVERLKKCFFCQPGGFVKGTSDTHTKGQRGTGHPACAYNGLQHEVFDTSGFSWVHHLECAHIFRSRAFRGNRDPELLL